MHLLGLTVTGHMNPVLAFWVVTAQQTRLVLLCTMLTLAGQSKV